MDYKKNENLPTNKINIICQAGKIDSLFDSPKSINELYFTNLNVQKPNQYQKWLFGLHFLSHQSGRKFNRNHYLDFPHSSIRIIRRSGGIKKSRATPMINTSQHWYTYWSLSFLQWLRLLCHVWPWKFLSKQGA